MSTRLKVALAVAAAVAYSPFAWRNIQEGLNAPDRPSTGQPVEANEGCFEAPYPYGDC